MKADFGKIISKSFSMMFKSRWLILLGSFAYFTGVLFSFQPQVFKGPTINFNSEPESQLNQQTLSKPSLVQQTDTEATSLIAEESTFQENFISTINPDTYFNIFVLITLLMIISVVIILLSIYTPSFSASALYYGISFLDEGEEIDLTEVSIRARKKVWKLFFSNLLTIAVAAVIILPLGILSFFSYGIIANDTSNFFILITAMLVFFFSCIFVFLAIISFYFSLNYLNYLVLFENKPIFDSIFYSYRLGFKYINENVIGCVITLFFGCIFGCITSFITGGLFLVIVGFFVATVASGSFLQTISDISSLFLSLPLVFILFLGIIVSFQVIQVVNSIVGIFFYSFNYLFAKDILKHEK